MLLSYIACKKDAHYFFYFANRSDTSVWVDADSYSVDPRDFQPELFDCDRGAHETLQIDPRNGLEWQRILYRNMRFVVCVYDKSLSAKCESESYEEFKQKHLLQENWYILDEINVMNGTIDFYPEK